MGALHEGHAELIRRAARPIGEGPVPQVLVSVFVNPLQFRPGEDYDRYPRDPCHDTAVARAAGVAALFLPDVASIFPGGVENITRVAPPSTLLDQLCAVSRPGHFEGVATVVCRLLALVRPCRLFLGEKDWQQLVILRRVLADLAIPTEIRACGTVRGSEGLALSSRNRYLSTAERRQACALPAALRIAAASFRSDPAAGSADRLLGSVRGTLRSAGLVPEYASLVEAHTLRPLQRVEGLTLLAVAVRCGEGRLIDHVFLMSRSPIVAIDGPAGAGKSTVSRALACRLGLLYLDTGAMYRALTWWVMHEQVDPHDETAVRRLLETLELELQNGGEEGQRISVQGQDVTDAIRGPEVTALVSRVASLPCVREKLTRQQQRFGRRGGLVAEGRDIGTAVFPDAECKIYLTATAAERARRRAEDLRRKGYAVPPLDELEAQITERDRRDAARKVAPLRQAEDALELITDGMTIDAVIEAMIAHFRARVPEDAWQATGADPPPPGAS